MQTDPTPPTPDRGSSRVHPQLDERAEAEQVRGVARLDERRRERDATSPSAGLARLVEILEAGRPALASVAPRPTVQTAPVGDSLWVERAAERGEFWSGR